VDPSRFDHLTRLLGRASDRRAVLGALLGAALGGTVADAGARKRRQSRGKHKDRDRNRDEDRQRNQNARAEHRGRDGKRRQRKKKRHDGSDGGGQPEPRAACCGSKQCAAPKPGSTRSQCNYAGRSFAGQRLTGAILRGIDGRETTFDRSDARGVIFAEACLQGASFRRANLAGATWGEACLFDADFTGAHVGTEAAVFNDALFCGTVMPDGSVNDRDCDHESPCCQRAEPGPTCRPDGGACTQDSDCCGGNCFGQVCADRPDYCVNASCPGNAVGCCQDTCCLPPSNQCNPGGLCCAPNCAGKQCGPDGCGGDGTCGDCPDGLGCNGDGECVCTPQSCRDGCCDGDNCRPGTTNQACGTGGVTCAPCGAGQSCQNQRCAACTPQCAGKQCGPDGCGGSCGSCPDGQRCQNGQCICDAQSCPDGCCANGTGRPGACRPGTNRQACGTGGEFCFACPSGADCLGQRCAICGPQTCPDGCCAANGTCQPGDGFGSCGGPGGGPCASCNGQQTCQDRQCVACGDPCICTGQSVCVDENAPNTICNGSSDSQLCYCFVSQTGRAICGGTVTILEPNGCGSDADCGPGGACVDSIGFVAGPCGGNGKPFCVAPCCAPDCAGKVCGPDGCGGNCGTCEGAFRCENGQCVNPCTPQTCPNGCCTPDGVCQPGTAKAACGRGGAACQVCGEAAICSDQQCEACDPKTCQELGATCGPAPDGCDNTLQCGVCPLGDTPSCHNGQCRACADACSDICAICLQTPDGSTLCAGNAVTGCRGEAPLCRTDADCAGSQFPTCVTSFVERATGRSETYADLCQRPDIVGICSSLVPCCKTDCAGKVCGPDGCGWICGSCGPCQECRNGTCQDTCGPCQECQNGTCQDTGLVCGGQCCGKTALCCTDAAAPYCCSNAICGCCNGACCCP
jgi:hypothetical protein